MEFDQETLLRVKELEIRLRAGDATAREEWIEEFRPLAEASAMKWTRPIRPNEHRDWNDYEDCVADALAVALQFADDLLADAEEIRKPLTFVGYRMRGTIIDKIRARTKSRQIEIPIEGSDDFAGAEVTPEIEFEEELEVITADAIDKAVYDAGIDVWNELGRRNVSEVARRTGLTRKQVEASCERMERIYEREMSLAV